MRWRATVIAALVMMIACCGPKSPPARSTAGLPFALTPPAGFALHADTGKTKTYTPGGAPVKPGEPRLVLTRSSKVFSGDDRVRQLAPEQFIRDLPALTRPRGFETGAVTIDELSGYETMAIATMDGLDVRVYCVKLFAADGTFTILGFAAGEEAATRVEEFRAAAATLTVR